MKKPCHLLLLSRGRLSRWLHSQSAAKYVDHLSLILDENGKDCYTSLTQNLKRVPLGHAEAVLKAAKELSRERPVDGVVTFEEDNVWTATLIAEALHIPGASLEAAYCCRNKYLMKEKWRSNGLPVPAFELIRAREEIKENLFSNNSPRVCKHILGYGSEYVLCVRNEQEMIKAWELITEEANKHFLNDVLMERVEKEYGKVMLVEQFVDGHEISVEAYTYGGKTKIVAIHDKPEINEQGVFTSTYTATPSRLPAHVQDQIVSLALLAVDALGIDNAVTHTEMKVTDHGPVLLETAARLGGAGVYSSLKYSLGIDMVRVACDIALGLEPDVQINTPRKTGFRQILGKAGIIKDIKNLEVVLNDDNVSELCLYVETGDCIRPSISVGSYGLGHIVVSGAEDEELRNKSMTSIQKIQWEYKNEK